MNIPLVLNRQHWMDALGVRQWADDMGKLEIFLYPAILRRCGGYTSNEWGMSCSSKRVR